jgi:hypothetical protein
MSHVYLYHYQTRYCRPVCTKIKMKESRGLYYFPENKNSPLQETGEVE